MCWVILLASVQGARERGSEGVESSRVEALVESSGVCVVCSVRRQCMDVWNRRVHVSTPRLACGWKRAEPCERLPGGLAVDWFYYGLAVCVCVCVWIGGRLAGWVAPA